MSMSEHLRLFWVNRTLQTCMKEERIQKSALYCFSNHTIEYLHDQDIRLVWLMVSHILYADGTLLFCNAEPTQVGYLRCAMLCFEAVSGLKVNLGKSEMILVGAVADIGTLAQILGCRVTSFPTLYLGLPLGYLFKSTTVWDSVVERFQKRLAGWKHQYIPKGGRMTLIKHTLSSLPTYFMSLFVIPVSVVKRLEKLQRDFL
ncbi:uncharacterized protein LOC131331645 [Rhododendron vialii]|uniref:uncharacterized protein LOC131331645 n=1 Tax=Rhododendron vialii TaxID=182163 RepID=UPI00265EEBE7|nr:uncharacterized protein LOC131331645 [Rhododendron vialii]